LYIRKLKFRDLPVYYGDYYGYEQKWTTDFEAKQAQAEVDVGNQLLVNHKIAREAKYQKELAQYEAAKQFYENELRVEAVEAQERHAADAEEQTYQMQQIVDELEAQIFQQQMNSWEISGRLREIDWNLNW
jgi:deoxyribodipyrimidine photolyase-like uncharacterized protein